MIEQKGSIKFQVGVKFLVEDNLIRRVILSPSNFFNCEIISAHPCKNIEKLIHTWLKTYLEQKELKIALPLDFSFLRPFTLNALKTIQSIPFGKTASYKQIAMQAGNALASRAIGNICHRNPFPLIIPCHRIINASGNIGGFAYDITLKQKMLQFENSSS